ncbi:PfkB family carbohydrate kinase [Bifidobacterium pullorum]|uniref:PfkB family carbohydrate kinase n=1 Tax=Bifidobacterium pullorum TaxID=78448 RepID=UPI00242BCD1A|nr:PfkB family carbohydrate kinase [Bifidobacterium pullorum]
MFDIRTAWRRLTAKISGSTDQEIIDTTEAEDSSGTTAPASVTPPATLATADVDDVPAPAPPAPTPSEETVADDPSATRPTRVISLGEVWVDIMMDVDSLPESGGFAASRSTIPTIDGSYRALLASRLMGTPTAHAGIIGAGPWASMIRHAFYEHDITHIGPDRLDADTGFRLVLNDTNGGKTFIATYGAEAQGGADTFDGIDLQPGDVVSISSNSLMDATAAGVDAFIRQAGSDPDARPYQIVLSPTSSLERVNDRLLEDLVLARPIWTCNRQAAIKLADRLGAPLDEVPVTVGGTFDNEMKALCDNLGTTLRAPLVIRAGARGAWVRLPGGEVTHVDGFPTKAVHKRSAGTVHTGVLCAMLATGRSLVEATQVANAAASLSIEHSENGIPVPPTRDEVLELIARNAE